MKYLIFCLIVLIIPGAINALPYSIDTLDYRITFHNDYCSNSEWKIGQIESYHWENGKIKSVTYRELHAGDTVDVRRDDYDYNQKGLLISYKSNYFNVNDSIWKTTAYDSLFYDNYDRIIELITTDNSQKSKTINFYRNNAKNPGYSLEFRLNEKSASWDTLSRTVYKYNSRNQKTEINTYNYNKGSGQFQKYSGWINKYNRSGLFISKEFFYYNENLINKNIDFKVLTDYDKSGNMTKYRTININSEKENEIESVEWTYDESGRLIKRNDSGGSRCSCSSNDGVRNLHSKTDYAYYEGGKVVLSKMMEFDENDHECGEFSYSIKHNQQNSKTTQSSESQILTVPNPAPENSVVNIILPEFEHDSVEIQIADSAGTIISKDNLSLSFNTASFTCPVAPPGVYFMRAAVGGKIVSTKRFVIE